MLIMMIPISHASLTSTGCHIQHFPITSQSIIEAMSLVIHSDYGVSDLSACVAGLAITNICDTSIPFEIEVECEQMKQKNECVFWPLCTHIG